MKTIRYHDNLPRSRSFLDWFYWWSCIFHFLVHDTKQSTRMRQNISLSPSLFSYAFWILWSLFQYCSTIWILTLLFSAQINCASLSWPIHSIFIYRLCLLQANLGPHPLCKSCQYSVKHQFRTSFPRNSSILHFWGVFLHTRYCEQSSD